ncbi:unnamed protein product [Schistocephalus solidus]|uniref:Mitotic interactor and substrate of PLK1 n=1 Tax=Schistocephalus solidus TaxID=70667 RepID=A0A183TIR0_SCHSO|nr:unnamed protein product [Schistocephalus solidus]
MTSYTGEDAVSLQKIDCSCADDPCSQNTAEGLIDQRGLTLLEQAPLSKFYNMTEEVEKYTELGEDPNPSDSSRSHKSSFVPAGGHLEEGQVFRPLSQSSMEASIRYYVSQQRKQPEGFLSDKRNSATPLDIEKTRKGSMFALGAPPAVFQPRRRFSGSVGIAADSLLSCYDDPNSRSMFRDVRIDGRNRKYGGQEQTWEKIKDKLEEETGQEVLEDEEQEEEEERDGLRRVHSAIKRGDE